MSNTPPRTPPRFVPTLTEVVHGHGLPRAGENVPSALPDVVPVVQAVRPAPLSPQAAPSLAMEGQASARPAAPAPGSTVSVPAQAVPEGFEEHMVHRVMQRVDVMLEKRLREAIATVVQEQTRSVLPRLREEIESVVRYSVYEAVADELASGEQQAPLA